MKKVQHLEINGETTQVSHSSSMYAIGWKDGLRATLIAAGTPIIYGAIEALQDGVTALDWRKLLASGLAAGLMYLAKNYFTPSQVVIKQTDIPQ